MIDNITDNFELYIKECTEEKYKIKINDNFIRVTSNDDNIYDNRLINKINYLFSFYPSKDNTLVFQCAKEIIDLYENIKIGKYNSAIQKFFIQLKEIKIESINESSKSIFSEDQNQRCKNETKNKNEEIDEEIINMMVIE